MDIKTIVVDARRYVAWTGLDIAEGFSCSLGMARSLYLMANSNHSMATVSTMVFAVIFGAFSHLLGDTFTINGVRLFWPAPLR